MAVIPGERRPYIDHSEVAAAVTMTDKDGERVLIEPANIPEWVERGYTQLPPVRMVYRGRETTVDESGVARLQAQGWKVKPPEAPKPEDAPSADDGAKPSKRK